jgi:uncharacterized protein (TIGR00255 family)
MISSMTGFISKTITLPSEDKYVALTINIKTLNSRFFDTTCRLAYSLSALETEFTKTAKKMLCRGHMYLTIALSDPNYFKRDVSLSPSLLKGYINALNDAQKSFGLHGTLEIKDIMNIPNIFVAEEISPNETIISHILDAFKDAVLELKKIRLAEGMSLLKDLEIRTQKLHEFIDSIHSIFKETFKKRQAEISAEIEELKANDHEIALQKRMLLYQELDRMDIHEEIVRFNTHLNSFETLLHKEQEEKGRQLDFILQELGREINTIASKCYDSTIGSHAISIKVELEKCREQVQNIV